MDEDMTDAELEEMYASIDAEIDGLDEDGLAASIDAELEALNATIGAES